VSVTLGLDFKIVSGGQTGADRAALDWAIACGVPHRGWCPLGRLAEDGALPLRYQLQETPTAAYIQRTEWNVRDSDGTVIFSIGATLSGGSLSTLEFARQRGKPVVHLCFKVPPKEIGVRLLGFIADHGIKVLNVAGPAESKEPGIYYLVHQTLDHLPLPEGLRRRTERAAGWRSGAG
jgi:hypothetical protein